MGVPGVPIVGVRVLIVHRETAWPPRPKLRFAASIEAWPAALIARLIPRSLERALSSCPSLE
jgi:hypothetical protein